MHTWHEQRAVTLDVYVCNFGADHSAKAHVLIDALLALFQPAVVVRHALQRGAVSGVAAFEASDHLAPLWLVPNPGHNPRGDFDLA